MTNLLELTLTDEGISEDYRCPCCYENRIDCLTWDEDDMLNCAMCGIVYDPLHPER